jgi:hypothetical protein
MKKIFLTIAASCIFTVAAVYAQTDSLNRQQPTQSTQYKNQSPTGQQGLPNPTDPTRKPTTSGSEEIEKQTNPQQKNNGVPTQSGQGTTSGSTPYDTTGTNRTGTGAVGTSGAGKPTTGTSTGTTGTGTTQSDSTLRKD